MAGRYPNSVTSGLDVCPIQRGDGLKLLATLILVIVGTSSSQAHQTWGNGLPVPEWVSKSCCGPADAHRLTPDQVRRVEHGYMIQGYPRIIYDAQVLPSEDGEYWAFYSAFKDADGVDAFTSVYCFFVPSAG